MRASPSQALLVGWILAAALVACVPALGEPPRTVMTYEGGFWDRWGDGNAEVASYELTFPRYGEARAGSAVAIFVTEPFSGATRVKSDRSSGDDVAQALKLNLVKDFSTGIYDYNTMLSAFVPVESKAGMIAGEAAKISYSSQEWCGHVYQQVLFDENAVRHTSHSYFDGEADQNGDLVRPTGGLAEDGLYLWARGLAAPALEPGGSARVPLLLSLQRARLSHRELDWGQATLSRDAGVEETSVPAGTFTVETYRAKIDGGPTWVFHVEREAPRRLIRWSTSDGEQAELVATDRLPYWQLHRNRDLGLLENIGLKPRPARTP